VLVEHAERILRSEDAARHALEAVTREVAGTIRVATFASSAATLLPPSIVAATARHPRLTALTLEVDVDAVTGVVERVTHTVTDTAVSMAMVAQGLGITMVTDMMLALASPTGLRTLRVREDVRRDVVLVRRHGDDARPVVQAMTTVIEETVSAAVAPASAA
jgi:DNA-binding transcriptional LysR family regulator